MAQKAVFLRLQLGEPSPQPVEPLAERLQILRAAHGDLAREIRPAQLPDRRVERRDRAGDVAREAERYGERDGGAEDDEQDEPALHRLGVRSQPHHLAVGHQVADGQDLVRVLGQFGRDAADPARILARARLRAEELVELLLQRDSLFERGKLLRI